MDVKWLEDFLALARLRSFSKAADARHVTQPAFSRRIQALELWAGAPLIDRSSHPVTLTAAGHKLRESADEMIRLLGSTRDDLRTGADSVRPTVQVSALHSLATSFFPGWLSRMQAAAGMFNSRLVATDFMSGIAALDDGECDFLITYWHPDAPVPLDPLEFPHVTVGADRLVEVHGAGQSPGDGAILRYGRDSFLGRLTLPLQRIEDGHGKPTHVVANAMAEGVKAMVLAGHGLAWLPESLVRSELGAGTLMSTGRELDIEIRVYRNARHRRPIVEAAWAATHRYAGSA